MDLHKQLLLTLLLLVQAGIVWAEPRVAIDEGIVSLSHFPMSYHIDQSRTLTYDDVKTLPFTETGNRTTLGTNARVTWYKLILDNTSDSEQQLFVHLPHAYHVKSVDFYQERGGEMVHGEQLDMNRADRNHLMFRGVAVYPITLPVGEPTTLYLRSFSYSHQWFAVELLDEHASKRALANINSDIALMVGMLLALVFYNGLMYFATSKKENIFYSLYLISGLVWIALSYGLIAGVFEAYGDAVFRLNISLITMPIFLLLFMMAIFETKQFYPTEHRFLQGLIVLLSGTLIWGLFDISAALKPASSLAALMMVVTLSVSVSLYRKGHPLVKYFLVGHSFFVLFNGIAVLFYKGLISPSYLNSHGVGIGIMLEALTLAFVISHRIKLLEDIRASQTELKKQAATDPLTKLFNRRYFFSEADFLLEMAKTSRTPLALMVIDIDHFKRINDEHGHATGDLVITQVAQTLKGCSRTQDVVARFGGEEFVVLMPDTGLQPASLNAERIRAAVGALSISINETDAVQTTVSIGVTQILVGTESVETAINRADKALYSAKESGRNRICRAPTADCGSGETCAEWS